MRARERDRKRQRVNEITFPKTLLVLLALAPRVPSRDRTSHVGFQNSSQFLLHKGGHISTAVFTTAKKNKKQSFCSKRGPTLLQMSFKDVRSKLKTCFSPLQMSQHVTRAVCRDVLDGLCFYCQWKSDRSLISGALLSLQT